MATEYISRAWKIYKKNYLSFIASELVMGLIPGLLFFLGFMVFFVSVLPSVDWSLIINTADEAILRQYFTQLFRNPNFLGSVMVGFLGMAVFVIIGFIVALYLSIGQVGMAYESLGGKTKLRTLFNVSGRLGFRWVLTGLLWLLIILISIIPVIIIGVFTLGLGFLALFLLIPIVSLMQPAMVVDDASPIGCFKKAWHAGKKNYLNLFALWLIYFAISAGISFFGAIFSYIPFFGWVFQLGANLFLWLVVYPMMLISFVDYYARNRSGARK